MKIQTLLELIDTKITTKKYDPRAKRGPVMGSGIYSTVTKDLDDPHMVRKLHHDPDTAGLDGFVKWGEYMIKHKLMNNPHLPRIYNISKEMIDGGGFVYEYTMEELTPLSKGNIRKDEFEALWRQHMSEESYPEDADEMSGEELMGFLGSIIMAAIEGDDKSLNDITSESLKEAVLHLRHYYEEESSNPIPDVHSDNVMMRRTPHGLQLVVTDPFA